MARGRPATAMTLAAAPLLCVFASGCGAGAADTLARSAPEDPAPRSAPAQQPELPLGVAVLGMTPRPGGWFDACASDSERLVELFERDAPRSPERTALYFDLLAKLAAFRVNGTSIDDARVEPIGRETPQFDVIHAQCRDLLAPHLAVPASGCDDTHAGAPCAIHAAPATPPFRPGRTIGDRMLDATPPAGAWFDGCDRLGRQLVRAFERLDHDLRTSPRQRALYLGLLAEVTALRVRALALDTPRVEPLDEDAKKQSRTDLGVACYDLLHEAIDAYERPQCGGPD